MSRFDDRASQERRSTAKDLIAVMLADRKVTREEEDFLAQAWLRAGLPPEEFRAILEHPESVPFTPAQDPKERAMQLVDAVSMMMVDGDVHSREMALCQSIAKRLGLPASVVPDLVVAIVEAVREGRGRSSVASEIEQLLNR